LEPIDGVLCVGRPLVSIVTPVLNRVETIGACLASVAEQTYQPIEQIVVDGGSTDGTLEFLEAYRPPHPFRWLSEPDNGMYEAINKGLSMARGDVLAYLNSDDIYLPWSLDVAVSALRPGTDLVYGDLGVLRPRADGKPAGFNILFYSDFDLRHYSFVGTLGQPTVFWQQRLTEAIGLFDTEYRLIGDCEYWLRAALAGATLHHIPEIMAVQVEHASTLRATEPVRLGDEFRTLRARMRDVIDPPAHMRLERLKGSLAWRVRNLEFLYAMKARHPRKWPHFVERLRAEGIEVTLGDLGILAPARWRRKATLFADVPQLSRLLRNQGT
jgi:glycosyltransferase involved in cell wall biosynthesis